MNKELKYVALAVAAVAALKLFKKSSSITGIGKLPKKIKIGSIDNSHPSIYLSTWENYNNGSLQGDWIDLSEFNSYDEFLDHCKKMFPKEKYPEYMIQDYENMPEGNWGEYHFIDEEDFDFIKEWNEELDNTEKEAYNTYAQITGNYADMNGFRDAYMGEFASGEDYAAYCVEEGLLSDETLLQYVDYAQLWRTLKSENIRFENGFIFDIY